MEETILVALDGSMRAEAVLPHAAQIATATGRGLLLLRVVPSPRTLEQLTWPPGHPIASPDQLEEEIGRARAYLRPLAERLRAAPVRVETTVRGGDPAAEILACAQEAPGIVQIALTTHGRSALGRWVFGSVAAKVLHGAPVPLLVVPMRGAAESPPAGPYRRILVPLDGSACAEQALDHAVTLAHALGAELLLATVTPSLGEIARAGMASLWLLTRYQAEDRLIERDLAQKVATLETAGLRAQARLHHGVPAEEILALGAQEGVDLIMMGTHGRSGWQQFWLGSVALRVLEGTTRPVLLVRSLESP